MDVTDISPHLDQLDGDLDRLEDALQPIVKDLGGVASKLPLLDKAKLYVLATYSIESTMYCKCLWGEQQPILDYGITLVSNGYI